METFTVSLAFVRGIHRLPKNSPNKDQWRGALMFSLICVWINGWVNIRDAAFFQAQIKGPVTRRMFSFDDVIMMTHNTATEKKRVDLILES